MYNIHIIQQRDYPLSWFCHFLSSCMLKGFNISNYEEHKFSILQQQQKAHNFIHTK